MSLTFTFRDGTTTTDTIAWAQRYEDYDYRRVKRSEFTDPRGIEWIVSTIWQGMPDMLGATRNYETIVLRMDEQVGRTYHATEEQAVSKHDDMVAALAATGRMDSIWQFLREG